MTAADAALETALALAAMRLSTATTPNQRRKAWDELRRLHAQRTPAEVERQEKARGLAR